MKTVLFALLLIPVISWAQLIKITPADTQRKHSYLLMRDGSVVRGQIVRQDSSLITVRVKGEDLSFIEADQVVQISATRSNKPVNTIQGRSPISSTVFILRDGSQVAGHYVRRDSTMITVRKRNGQLTYFEPELLVRVDTIRTDGVSSDLSASSGKVSYANRFSPWLLTRQTAYNAGKGQFYYRNTLIVLTQFSTSFSQLNEFDYGITRNWSVGLSLQPQINDSKVYRGSDRNFLSVNARFFSKLSFPIGDQFRVGVNATYLPRQKRSYYSVIQQVLVQGLMSFGDSQRNATLGFGVRIYPDYTTSGKMTFITAGVMHKISRNLTFLSDNTFYLNPSFGSSSAEVSVALRLNRRRHAFDVGAQVAMQPISFFDYGFGPYNPGTRTYVYPYIAYNLIIGQK